MILLTMLTGVIWQRIMVEKDADRYTPKGLLLSINSHEMHAYCTGKGDTTVVFISGSGTPCAYTDFYYLQSNLIEHAKTISYDHAGYGWSKNTAIPRSIDILADELRELLIRSEHSPPYILVGHSLASLEAIRYAQKYPDDVKGIVLLDGGSPEFYVDDLEWPSMMLNRISAGLRVTGISRSLSNFGIILPFAGERLRSAQLPDGLKELDIAMYNNRIGLDSNLNAIGKLNENAQIVVENGYLENIPLSILSSDSGDEWERVQQQLLHWSNISEQKTIKNAQHYVHWSDKDIVISEILEMLYKTNG